VTRDVPPNATVVGIPGKIVKRDGVYVSAAPAPQKAPCPDPVPPQTERTPVMDDALNALDPQGDTLETLLRELAMLRARVQALENDAPPLRTAGIPTAREAAAATAPRDESEQTRPVSPNAPHSVLDDWTPDDIEAVV